MVYYSNLAGYYLCIMSQVWAKIDTQNVKM
jgi:hypothetical protein